VRIAIIGSGVSGLVCAHLLCRHHDVTLFEAEPRAGDVAHTVTARIDGIKHAIDTGFIVYNERNYLLLTRLFAELSVMTRPSETSFAMADDDDARALPRGLDHLVEVRNPDHRDVTGTYDKLVSIEMIEAVGWRQLDTYFSTCAKLLRPEGLMALQAVTINDFSYERAKNCDDFIKRMIFPSGFRPSLEVIVRSSSSVSDLRVVHLEDIGRHYAETLSRGRANLPAHAVDAEELTLGEEFDRMWRMYPCYCETAFLERHISDVQLVLARGQWPAPLGPSASR